MTKKDGYWWCPTQNFILSRTSLGKINIQEAWTSKIYVRLKYLSTGVLIDDTRKKINQNYQILVLRKGKTWTKPLNREMRTNKLWECFVGKIRDWVLDPRNQKSESGFFGCEIGTFRIQSNITITFRRRHNWVKYNHPGECS